MMSKRDLGAILAVLLLGTATQALAQQAQEQPQVAPPQEGVQPGTGPQRLQTRQHAPGMMQGRGMGAGMMGQGMGQPGRGMGMMGQDMGPGMMGQGMGPGTMGQGMGPGTMGQGMGPGAMAGRHMLRIIPMMHLSTDDVRHFLEHHIRAHGLQHLEIGEVEQTDDETITAEVVTTEGSLAMRLSVDPHTGWVVDAE